MHRIIPGQSWPLFDTAALRQAEQAAAAQLPPHALMQRAGLAVARLALALAPHARTIWVACGPGNNGGDGLEAAMHLQQWGKRPVVTWLGDPAKAPPDAKASLERARGAGVVFANDPPPVADLAVDALLGIGVSRPPEGAILAAIARLNAGPAPVLAVDVPSGLSSDTGQGESVRARHTLTLLALKPGLFTGRGRDAAGEIWFDDLGAACEPPAACACLSAAPAAADRPHASHKGSYGDVAVVGGARGMAGAALLAAYGALHAGAGRVYVGTLDPAGLPVDAAQPELMFRDWDALEIGSMTVAAGCGGAHAIRPALAKLVSRARALVLDADALNAIAADQQLAQLLLARSERLPDTTVLTPHPLEAARLLRCGTADVQADRLAAARELVSRYRCTVVLKGSGTVVAAPDHLPAVNPTGHARLATAGTGDVLAGMVAARLARGEAAFAAACAAAYRHGATADAWPSHLPLTASALARAI